MQQLTGKTAVVTGAASGMGLAFTEAFLDEGMSVVMADIEAPALREAADALSGRGRVHAVRTDVSNLSSVLALRDEALQQFGQINVVCNNAGVGGSRFPVGKLQAADWQWILGVNLFGVINGCEAFLPHLRSHDDGHLVNTASVAGHLNLPFMAPYNVSKHGVVALSESIYHELAHAGSTVGVSVLCPGFVATNLIDAARNRPEHLLRDDAGAEQDPVLAQQMAAVKEVLSQRKPPTEVAQLVVAAIKANQFWIFTDNQFAEPIAARHRSIEAGTNPERAATLLDYLLG